jgi:hypothetical protein
MSRPMLTGFSERLPAVTVCLLGPPACKCKVRRPDNSRLLAHANATMLVASLTVLPARLTSICLPSIPGQCLAPGSSRPLLMSPLSLYAVFRHVSDLLTCLSCRGYLRHLIPSGHAAAGSPSRFVSSMVSPRQHSKGAGERVNGSVSIEYKCGQCAHVQCDCECRESCCV